MIVCYTGFDKREEVGFHTFVSSVLHHTSEPVAFIPLNMDMQRDGSNAFTYARFLIPYLQNYEGWALFVDGADMIVKADLAELWVKRDESKAVQVVQHHYKTQHPRKYVGTKMEADNRDYACKNWSSVMLINCAHRRWRKITPETVANMNGAELHRFSFLDACDIGELSAYWNWLADEYGPNPEAKLLHWTAGIPAFEHYKNAPHAADWFAAKEKVTHATD